MHDVRYQQNEFCMNAIVPDRDGMGLALNATRYVPSKNMKKMGFAVWMLSLKDGKMRFAWNIQSIMAKNG